MHHTRMNQMDITQIHHIKSSGDLVYEYETKKI